MAITYHSGRRIQGTPTYLDNFEYASQSTADDKWIPATTLVRVNVTDKTLGYTIERHSTNDICYYDLGTANISETKWVCRFKLVTTAVNGGGSSHKMGFFGLSSGTGSWSTSVDKIGFHHQISSNTAERDIHPAYASDGNYGAGSQAELSTQVVAGTHYYELSRLSSSQYRITISSTDAYNGDVEDETYTNLSGITGLQYFVIVNANDYTISGSLVGYIDDLKFYNGVTSISSGNVQVGSRYEETDTRKMYHYESPSVTFEDDFSSSPNGWTLGSGQTIESGYLYADGNDVLSSKPLAIGEPTNFIFDFDYAPVDGAPRITFVVLNSEIGGYGAASSGHKRIIFGLHQNGLSMDIRYRISGSSEVEVISIDSTVPPYDGTISYYRMIKTSGNVTVKRYASDANRTSDTSVSQTVSLDFTESGYSGTADLAYLVVGGKGSDASYSRNAKLYDFKFYSVVTSLDNVWSEEGT